MAEVAPEIDSTSTLGALVALTKPVVISLLQVTALSAVLIHDLIQYHLGNGFDVVATMWTCFVVFIGGFLTAGGANSINMWFDADIDPFMGRTAERPVPAGNVTARTALLLGILLAIIGTIWLIEMANEVAAFWAAFSVLFYVIIYTMWLKRRTSQNIVIGGIAGSTPPLIGWAAANDTLSMSHAFDFGAVLNLGAALPWLMFMLIFLWTPPHFWALALFRDREYTEANVPMLPSVKGGKHTISEMRVYTALLIGISAIFIDPIMWGFPREDVWSTGWAISTTYFAWALLLGVWYNQSVLNINLREPRDEKGRIPSAFSSFMISMKYLALLFVTMVMVVASFYVGLITLAGVAILEVYRHWKKDSKNMIGSELKPVGSMTE
nr:protoheme IX farnesyltransferase [Euryarchaeota archaeon]